MSLKERITKGWNAFLGRDPTFNTGVFASSFVRPDHVFLSSGGERSIANSILNRIAVDAATLTYEHARLDENGRYKEPIISFLHECLTLNANNDQSARAFMQDAVMSLLDEGVIAIVPTKATANPMITEGYDIGALRVGKVTNWYPEAVAVKLYNEDTGNYVERIFPKSMVALPENPFYTVMNAPNSIYQRLVRKLSQLDNIDAQSASGKLDLIIQLPYSTRSSFRQEQAGERRAEIEKQLSTSKYGIAYIDVNEKVIQLNRAVENNLFNQVEYYMNLFFAQLGVPMSVFDGTADEATMLNYFNRTIEPIVSSIVDAMKWKFLSKSARTKGHTILFFNDPFKYASATDVANNADKLIRNEILTKNEFRQVLGYKPSNDPTADKLNNPNMPIQDEVQEKPKEEEPDKEG